MRVEDRYYEAMDNASVATVLEPASDAGSFTAPIAAILKEKFEPHVVSDWSNVELVQHLTQLVSADAEMARDGSLAINVYPSLTQKLPRIIHFTLLREFGKLEFSKGGDEAQDTWQKKLVLPCKDQIEAVQSKLSSRTFHAYHELVASFSTAPIGLIIEVHAVYANFYCRVRIQCKRIKSECSYFLQCFFEN